MSNVLGTLYKYEKDITLVAYPPTVPMTEKMKMRLMWAKPDLFSKTISDMAISTMVMSYQQPSLLRSCY